jgi:hypothetical protein
MMWQFRPRSMCAEAGAGIAPRRAIVTAPTAIIFFFMGLPLSVVVIPFDDFDSASVNLRW